MISDVQVISHRQSDMSDAAASADAAPSAEFNANVLFMPLPLPPQAETLSVDGRRVSVCLSVCLSRT